MDNIEDIIKYFIYYNYMQSYEFSYPLKFYKVLED